MRKSLLVTNSVCDHVVDKVDLGTDNSSGRLNIFNSDGTMISYLPFSIPAFMDSTDGTAVSYALTDSTAFMDATMAYYHVVNRDSTMIWDGSCVANLSIGDIKFNSLVVPQNSPITIQTMYYFVPR